MKRGNHAMLDTGFYINYTDNLHVVCYNWGSCLLNTNWITQYVTTLSTSFRQHTCSSFKAGRVINSTEFCGIVRHSLSFWSAHLATPFFISQGKTLNTWFLLNSILRFYFLRFQLFKTFSNAFAGTLMYLILVILCTPIISYDT